MGSVGDARSPQSRRRWRWARWSAALALVALAAVAGHRLALHAAVDRLREAADHRLDMLASALESELTRFAHLPALLEMMPVVPALLAAPADAALRAAVNRYLGGVNATAGADMLYVLDAAGVSLAASDFDKPGTTVGQDLSFRPYVADALQHGHGSFYGMGITSKRPGYFVSYALRDDLPARGVVAVKVDLAGTERSWRSLPGDVVLLDERGVVILSTRDELRFRPVRPLDALQLAELERARPYGNAALQPLPWTHREQLARQVSVIALEGRDQLASARTLRSAPWQLIALDDLAPARTSARNGAFTAALAMSVLLLLAVTLWQRRRAVRHKLANQAALQQAHDTLESTVVARTAQLREAQNELVHAGKMGALGQMSAGLVHELNQPLTAMRTLAESAAILLEQHRPQEVQDNLHRITRMVDRLARLTTQLKTFAHKAETPGAPVPLAHCLADAQASVAEAARQAGVQTVLDLQPPELQVLADEAALSSVLVNLMRNAIEAMQATPERTLRITAQRRGGRAVVEVRDTGHGIAADILPRLFEPFVTSKPAGAGLGLGLVISAQLLRALNGSLSAHNTAGGGACFVIELDAVPPSPTT
ncbi:sensor histidine kinase [Pseudorhodoferax soli]|uniref:C4-dicarboxylate transport sensor protein DctB n=1 Tax=Pseudorhodoferax soli TaxID=545864 RepID=A0A368XXW0_9BURK|nr:ATP-binding protein [Pseudorhodoferax soli]RCW72930.1 two-component system C4-dicarboxylate transport sensor histidine kinase DctB [Pseudorhodoferax soli]